LKYDYKLKALAFLLYDKMLVYTFRGSASNKIPIHFAFKMFIQSAK